MTSKFDQPEMTAAGIAAATDIWQRFEERERLAALAPELLVWARAVLPILTAPSTADWGTKYALFAQGSALVARAEGEEVG